MTSGVYQLTFSSGKTYIGKSVNIEERWKQHYDKMCKGTAAKAMQHEFTHYGEPSGKIVVTCHPDHIDILEACCIARMSPELNSDRPPDPFKGISIDTINGYLKDDMFDKSTLEHIERINDLSSDVVQLEEEVAELTETNSLLEEERSIEEIQVDISNRLGKQLDEIGELEEAMEALEQSNYKLLNENGRLRIAANRTWWQRLFD